MHFALISFCENGMKYLCIKLAHLLLPCRNMVTRTDPPKPSPVGPRKVYDRQDSTSPRPTRRTYNILQTNLLGKPGSM